MATSLALKYILGRRVTQPKKNLGVRVVKTLTAELKGKGHHVFDNFFTNEHLLQDPFADDIYSCGKAKKGWEIISTCAEAGQIFFLSSKFQFDSRSGNGYEYIYTGGD